MSKLGTIFKMANSPPRITTRRGGRAIKKISRSIRFSRGRGGVPIDGTRNTTPAASIRRLRAIFLVTPPPLLAVMRGGEFALFKMRPLNHISLSRPRCTRLSTTPATLTWTDVPRRGAATQKTLTGGEGNFSLNDERRFVRYRELLPPRFTCASFARHCRGRCPEARQPSIRPSEVLPRC